MQAGLCTPRVLPLPLLRRAAPSRSGTEIRRARPPEQGPQLSWLHGQWRVSLHLSGPLFPDLKPREGDLGLAPSRTSQGAQPYEVSRGAHSCIFSFAGSLPLMFLQFTQTIAQRVKPGSGHRPQHPLGPHPNILCALGCDRTSGPRAGALTGLGVPSVKEVGGLLRGAVGCRGHRHDADGPTGQDLSIPQCSLPAPFFIGTGYMVPGRKATRKPPCNVAVMVGARMGKGFRFRKGIHPEGAQQ